MEDLFDRCGRVRNVTLGWNRRLNEPRGHAFVEFVDLRDAEDAFHRYAVGLFLIYRDLY